MIWVTTALLLSLRLGTNLQTLSVLQVEERSSELSEHVLNGSTLPRVRWFVASELGLALTHVTQLTITRERSLNREERATLEKLHIYT